MKDQYSFITKWQVKAPVEAVWNAIYESTEWPQWWKGVLDVKVIKKGEENGIDGIRSYTWKSILPYKLSFNMQLTQRQDFELLKGIAFGELEGDGTWMFNESDGNTYIQYNWNVYTTKAWMNYFSPFFKPAFKYNHNVVMRWGAKGLAKKLHAELVAYN